MKIGFLEYSTVFAGAERSLHTLISYLPPQLFQPYLIMLFPQPHQKSYEDLQIPMIYLAEKRRWWMGGDRWRRPLRGTDCLKRLIFSLKLVRFLKREKISILHINLMRMDGLFYALIPRLFGIKVVHHVRSNSQWQPRKALLKLSSAVICVSQDVRKRCDAVWPSPNLHVLYDSIIGLPAADFDCREVKELSLKPDVKYCSSVGLLVPPKGHEEAIRTFALLASEYPDLNLIVAGGGSPEYLAHLKVIAADFGLSERILFTGRQIENIAVVYSISSFVFSLTTMGEGFGRVPFESAWYGTPVIAPVFGAAPELLRDRESAMLVDPTGSLEIIADAARYLLDHPERAKEMAVKTRTIIETKLNPVVYAEKLRDIYEALSCR